MANEQTEVRTSVDGRLLTLTNLDKVLYPGVGFSKAEVIDYYLRIAPTLLPHVAGRVLTRVRFPDGVGEGRVPFYEKNAPRGTPEWVRRVAVDTGDGTIDYVVAEEAATLVWLANLAALELHAPQWTVAPGVTRLRLPSGDPRADDPQADRVVVDLDPGAGMTIVDTARAALLVAARMAADGLIPVAQTSGSKGMQVYAAVAPCPTRTAWAYARALNAEMSRRHPDLFVASMSVEQRAGRIYLDYNQDLAARNTISPYSLRGRDRPAVATPVGWDEVGAVTGPDDLRFGPADVLDRVATRGDLAADLLLDAPAALPAAPVV